MKHVLSIERVVVESALDLALANGFPGVVRILGLFSGAGMDLEAAEIDHLRRLAEWIRYGADLHFPYWDDDRPNHDPSHDDCFQTINMGLHEKLKSTLLPYVKARLKS
jgi:hypothetical protein